MVWCRAGGMDSLSSVRYSQHCLRGCASWKNRTLSTWAFCDFWGAELAVPNVLHGLLEELWVPSGHFCKAAAELHSSACQYLKIICMPV